LEANPYESKNQRKQWEVKALLEKIQPELINLDPFKLKHVDTKTLEEKMIENNKKLVGI
jgi:U3 small nucleolar RNA-associated protein 7